MNLILQFEAVHLTSQPYIYIWVINEIYPKIRLRKRSTSKVLSFSFPQMLGPSVP